MGVGQDLVDFPDVAGSVSSLRACGVAVGGWIEARETAARRTTAPEWRDAPDTAGGGRLPRILLAGIPAGKTLGLSRQVVECGGQCGEAEVETRGVDRVVGRGRRR